MPTETLESRLFTEICRIPIIDPHSHINPHSPASRTLDDILGYHYYTELAHSAGMSKDCLASDFDPKERVRTILSYMDHFDNTAQYSWFLEIARTFLGFEGDRITAADTDWLWSAAEKQMSRPDWEEHVLKTTNVEQIYLTNDFDDPLEGFDTKRYVPCLRVDDLVFKLNEPTVRERLTTATSVEVLDDRSFQIALATLFKHFVASGAKACAISLPPEFAASRMKEPKFDEAMITLRTAGIDNKTKIAARWVTKHHSFWSIVEHCRQFKLPFDLMVGVDRDVYKAGVHQGRDLFSQITSLVQNEGLFNAFLDVTFCVSVLSHPQNQELASYSWIFPNVVTSGHWWYSNIPAYIEQDCRARLHAVPKTKQIGYYSDAYKLEFILPKYNMYRRILAGILAKDYVIERGWGEERAVELARLLLRDNALRIFGR